MPIATEHATRAAQDPVPPMFRSRAETSTRGAVLAGLFGLAYLNSQQAESTFERARLAGLARAEETRSRA